MVYTKITRRVQGSQKFTPKQIMIKTKTVSKFLGFFYWDILGQCVLCVCYDLLQAIGTKRKQKTCLKLIRYKAYIVK